MRSPPTAATESPKKHPETQGSQHQTNKQDSIKQSMREPPWGSRSASPLSTWGFFLHHLGLEREPRGTQAPSFWSNPASTPTHQIHGQGKSARGFILPDSPGRLTLIPVSQKSQLKVSLLRWWHR